MVITDFKEGSYAFGYICNLCRKSGNGNRWCCVNCTDDYCFNCIKLAVDNEINVVTPSCGKNHKMAIATNAYSRGRYICNLCRDLKTGYRWFCNICRDDYCFSCSPYHKEGLSVQAVAAPVVSDYCIMNVKDICDCTL